MFAAIKILTIGTAKIITVTILKMEQFGCAEIHSKIVNETTNSVDPDQTAPFGAV